VLLVLGYIARNTSRLPFHWLEEMVALTWMMFEYFPSSLGASSGNSSRARDVVIVTFDPPLFSARVFIPKGIVRPNVRLSISGRQLILGAKYCARVVKTVLPTASKLALSTP
jgi:hypothetical protein